MRVIFAGTPEFARVALQALLDAGHEVGLVLTQPDRPAGRGLKLHPSAVKQLAQTRGIEVIQPRSLRLHGKAPDEAAAAQAAIAAVHADVMVVAAYGLILPQWVLDTPRLGCLNIHASLLPRWRGAAPIHRAIEAGDPLTGVTIMQMDAGLDTGAMLAKREIPVAADETTGSLHDKLAALGGLLIVQALAGAARGELQAAPQTADGVTYAHKIDKAESMLAWTQPASALERKIRAFDPAPGATTVLRGETLKLWRAQVQDAAQGAQGAPGTILAVGAAGIEVACGTGMLRLTELQRPGGRRLPAADFLRGVDLAPGLVLGQPG